MELETYIVNAFTDRIAEGNPAGVVILDRSLPDDLLRRIAVDIGRSETAFIRREGAGTYAIRWFSPKKEMPLCGHATLAAAKVLYTKYPGDPVVFTTPTYELHSEQQDHGTISLEFPLDDYEHIDHDPIYHEFFPGIAIEECIRGRTTRKVIVIVPEEIDITAITPAFPIMRAHEGVYSQGIAISKASREFDVESRYFNPWAGVDEDPITGSVHTVLARYWGERLHTRSLLAVQRSYRPGVLGLTVDGAKVHIAGRARIVFTGRIHL